MVDVSSTPKLKRRREGVEPQRKKIKTEGKSKAGPSEDVLTTPKKTTSRTLATESISTPQKKNLATLTPTNGTKENEANTPSSQNKNKPASPSQQARGKEGKKSRRRSKAEDKDKKKPSWSVSQPIGGRFHIHDVVFSSDEKHLFLASSDALHVWSADSSLLVRSLLHKGVTSYALSSTNPNRVYVATAAGLIVLWDWTKGDTIARWDIGAEIRDIAVVQQPDVELDLVFCHEIAVDDSSENKVEKSILKVHALRTHEQEGETESKVILKPSGPISSLQILSGGNVIVVATETSVVVGKRTKLHRPELATFRYLWNEAKLATPIATIHAYIHRPEGADPSQNPAFDLRPRIDVAIGDTEGVILIYEDIMSAFISATKKNQDNAIMRTAPESLEPRRLHWHRDSVGSIKWTHDGNYLISGGDETVMVLWQLSTGKQQFLPHLTAAIENVSISPSGTSYGIMLANNSVIVLSTTELQPKTNIIGLQSRNIPTSRLGQVSIPKEDDSSSAYDRVPLVLDPKDSNQVLFSAPSSQNRQLEGKPSEPYLQTFDILSQRAISRQALARNNATNANIGPGGIKLKEPSVKFMQISHDGQWLASIDEWKPPQVDMDYLYEGVSQFAYLEQNLRREVYLKFWKWDDKASQWTLVSRVDAPHFFDGTGAGAKVFDLISDPSKLAFTTVGADCFVRVWQPKTRTRGGVTVRGAKIDDGEALVNWSLHREIRIPSSLSTVEESSSDTSSSTPYEVRLAASPDGSVIAAGVTWRDTKSDPGIVHIIDAVTGSIRQSITELNLRSILDLGIVDRYLVAVGNSILVWNLVDETLVYKYDLKMAGISNRDERLSLSRLAINNISNTFAVAYPRFEFHLPGTTNEQKVKTRNSQVAIFSPTQAGPLSTNTVPDVLLLALVAGGNSNEFVALDSKSALRTIKPKSSAIQLATPPPESAPSLLDSGEQSDEKEEEFEESRDSHALLSIQEDVLASLDDNKPVVRPEQLQHIFDVGPSHATPPVKNLLDAIVGLYARKPRAANTK